MRYSTKLLPSRSGNVGIVTLNNLKSLNALTIDMIYAFQDVLKEQWFYNHGNSINLLLVKSATPDVAVDTKLRRPNFCAGGDVKQIYLSGVKEHNDSTNDYKVGQGVIGLDSADFFRQEYILNYMLATGGGSNTSMTSSSKSKKIPQVSLWDGTVMGGGAGISVYGKYRIATEHTIFAMPETAIGFFPDIGSSFWMNRLLSPSVASYIALTGQRLLPADLLYTGLATHYIPSQRLLDLEQDLIQASTKNITADYDYVAPILMSYHETDAQNNVDESYLQKNQSKIDAIFGVKKNGRDIGNDRVHPPGIETIFERLMSHQNENNQNGASFYRETLQTLQKMSPTSLKITLHSLNNGCNKSIEECLQMEYRLSQALVRSAISDFYTGVKHVLIDKKARGGSPEWVPKTIDSVSDEMMESYYFGPIENEWYVPPDIESATTTTATQWEETQNSHNVSSKI